jgi:cysteinyl-tRNA synthetase
MSKSLGNFFLVRDILKKFPGDVVRFFLLATHYRSPLDFDDKKLEEHQKALERVKNTVRNLKEALERTGRQNFDEISPVDEQFIARLDNFKKSLEEAMDDDFNTALAIGVLFDLCRETNSYISSTGAAPGSGPGLEKAWQLLKVFADDILGIVNTEDLSGNLAASPADALVDELMNVLLEVRQEARAKKDWHTADAIRDKLKAIGITIEDTPHGPRWKR